MNFLKDILTENNGTWFCPIRAGGILSLMVFLFLEIWTVCIKHHDLDAVAFGGACAAILGALAAAITAKGKLMEGDPGDGQ